MFINVSCCIHIYKIIHELFPRFSQVKSLILIIFLQESDGEFVSCKDKDSRKSKCPCLRDNVGCTSDCRCRHCGNIYNSPDDLPGKRQPEDEPAAFKGKAKRRRSNPQVSSS
jgi:hypothetical protein